VGGATVSFTIVIPTIPGRESLLSRCLHSITAQPGDCQILVIGGDGLLGDKVNRAAQLVETEHMTIVDDDDWLADSYVESIEAALETDPDYVGLKVLCTIDGKFMQVNATRGDHDQWTPYWKGPVPKGVTRTQIWRDTPMGNHYTADRDWMAAAAGKVKTSVFIDRELYFYDYWPNGSSFAPGGNVTRDVGTWPYDRNRVTHA
jgi:hypothetical protein